MIISSPLYGKDEYNSILFKANIDKIETIVTEFGIYDTPNFLSALDLLEDPSSVLKDGIITSSDADTTLRFIATGVSALESAQVNEKVLETTLEKDSDVEFSFTTDLINKIKKASSVFKTFDTMWLTNDTGRLSISMGTANSFSKNNNSFNVTVPATVSSARDFNLSLPLESIQKVPSMDYTFMVKYNEAKDASRVILENDLFVFLLSLKK